LASFKESPVKHNQSPEAARRPAAKLSVVFYLYSPEGATSRSATSYRLDIANFPYPLSFCAFSRGDSFWIYG